MRGRLSDTSAYRLQLHLPVVCLTSLSETPQIQDLFSTPQIQTRPIHE